MYCCCSNMCLPWINNWQLTCQCNLDPVQGPEGCEPIAYSTPACLGWMHLLWQQYIFRPVLRDPQPQKPHIYPRTKCVQLRHAHLRTKKYKLRDVERNKGYYFYFMYLYLTRKSHWDENLFYKRDLAKVAAIKWNILNILKYSKYTEQYWNIISIIKSQASITTLFTMPLPVIKTVLCTLVMTPFFFLFFCLLWWPE